MAGTLILCATPIGNLDDAPPRLGHALGSADIVYAEDTRRSRILLDRLGVRRPIRSYFAGNEEARAAELGGRLAAGETVALLTDAGVPGISDPGLSAVRAAVAAGAVVTAIPGPSAVTTALAVAGLPADRFVFEGFLPRKGRARTERLAALAGEERTIVLFAAPGRVADDLEALGRELGPDREVVVTRELTKAFEEVWRGSLGAAGEHWRRAESRGEFTLVVAGAPSREPDLAAALDEVERAVAAGEALAAAVRRVARSTRTRRNDLYAAALDRRIGGDG